jgi:hypothetical protein
MRMISVAGRDRFSRDALFERGRVFPCPADECAVITEESRPDRK